MDEWKRKLEQLSSTLQADERTEQERKSQVLKGFRRRLAELEPVITSVVAFGDAFGVDCEWEISRFDDRYPYLRFRIRRPSLEYHLECKDGILGERLREGEGAAVVGQTSLEALAPRRFEQRLTQWVQTAANANRKPPGKRR